MERFQYWAKPTSALDDRKNCRRCRRRYIPTYSYRHHCWKSQTNCQVSADSVRAEIPEVVSIDRDDQAVCGSHGTLRVDTEGGVGVWETINTIQLIQLIWSMKYYRWRLWGPHQSVGISNINNNIVSWLQVGPTSAIFSIIFLTIRVPCFQGSLPPTVLPPALKVF